MHKKSRILWYIVIAFALGFLTWSFADFYLIMNTNLKLSENQPIPPETLKSLTVICISLCIKIFAVLVGLFIFTGLSLKKKANILIESNKELDALTANIPGGVQRCLNDEYLTIQYLSDGFLSLTGFSPEEVAINFDNKYINMIFPADRSRVRTEIALNGNEKFEIQYRLIKKDGSTLWILDKGQLVADKSGASSYYCVLVDINKLKEAERDLLESRNEIQISNERYQIIMDQSESIIFEYDILNHTIMFSGRFKKKFGFEPLTSGFPQSTVEEGLVHPDDCKKFLHFYEKVESRNAYNEGEFRFILANGSYAWFDVKVTTIYDENGAAVKAIGRLSDITKRKAETQELIARSEKDMLTGLYNKTTTQNLIESTIKDQYNSQHAILMVDIDDFKHINDSFGHGFGDTTLSELSSKLKRLFRSSDIVGRIGGDEFMIFMKDLKKPEMIAEKAEDICKMLYSIYNDGEKNTTVSASVGISVFPQDGTTYDELYKKADTALYRAKSNGKNTYMFYNDRTPAGSVTETQ